MTTSFQNRLPSLPIIFVSLFITVIGFGCGGGGGGGAPAAPVVISTDQDAQGLYTTNGDGSGTFKSTGNPDVVEPLTDIKGMVYGDLPNQKFIFFDVTANVLYQGEITAITLTDFVGTATVYHDGVMVDNLVTVSGTVISRSSIDMTLAASGNFVGGSIKGSFSSEYDKAASNDRIRSDTTSGFPEFIGPIAISYEFAKTDNFKVQASNAYFSQSISNQTPITQCVHNGTMDVSSNKNIFILQEAITVTLFTCPIVDSNYEGVASVVDGASIDTQMWYAVTNGSYSVFAVLDN